MEPFGVGKTSAAQRIVALDDQWRLFDPEWVGYMLRANLAGIQPADFQDIEAWRTLVPIVAKDTTPFVAAHGAQLPHMHSDAPGFDGVLFTTSAESG
jgi:hypothetical protein